MINRAVPLKQKICIGLANTGTNMLNNVISGAFLKYYTDYIGIEPELYGLAFLIFAIWNAINDPIFGFISDQKIPTKKGKRLPFIRRSMPLYFLGFYLMVFTSPSWSQGLIFAALLVGLLIYDTGLAMYGININALQTSLTDDLAERASISIISSYVNLVPLAVVGLIPVAFYANNASHETIIIMFFIIGTLGLIMSVYGIYNLKEPIEIYKREKIEKPLGLKKSLRESLKSRSFLIYTTFGFMIAGLTASYFGFISYYFIDIQAFPALQTTIISAGGGIILNITYPFLKKVTKKIGARSSLIIFLGLGVFGYICMYFLPADTPYSFALTFILYSFSMIAYGSYWLLNTAMIGDIVDEDELKTGQRRDGMFFGMNALITTPAISLVMYIFTKIINIYGYDGDAIIQSAEAIHGLRLAVCVVPTIFLILGIIAIYFYPLHGAKYQKLKDDIENLYLSRNETERNDVKRETDFDIEIVKKDI